MKMKKVFIAIAILFSLSATAQNYNDTLVTVQLTQRAAWYIGFYIKNLPLDNIWENRLTPTTFKPYVGSGTNPDSLYSVSVKSSYIKGMVELLLSGQNEVVQTDRLSIINASPTIGGYTSLATQIVNKAAGNTSEKLVAQYILDFYNLRVTQLAALRTANINSVIYWANH